MVAAGDADLGGAAGQRNPARQGRRTCRRLSRGDPVHSDFFGRRRRRAPSEAQAGKRLIEFLASARASEAIRSSGLEPRAAGSNETSAELPPRPTRRPSVQTGSGLPWLFLKKLPLSVCAIACITASWQTNRISSPRMTVEPSADTQCSDRRRDIGPWLGIPRQHVDKPLRTCWRHAASSARAPACLQSCRSRSSIRPWSMVTVLDEAAAMISAVCQRAQQRARNDMPEPDGFAAAPRRHAPARCRRRSADYRCGPETGLSGSSRSRHGARRRTSATGPSRSFRLARKLLHRGAEFIQGLHGLDDFLFFSIELLPWLR